MLDDDQTWKDLWRDLTPRLLVYLASFRTLSREDRQDIVQRVFLKAQLEDRIIGKECEN
jgi:DNA-directed RNA polymerase specialized sigma24 family protein